MFILPVSTTSFGARPTLNATATKALSEKAAEKITELTLPSKNAGESIPIKIIGDLGKGIKERTNITSVEYQVREKSVAHNNKQGFTYNTFDRIINEIERNVGEGIDFLYEFLKAQKKFKI